VFHSSSFISRSALTALCLACTEDELEDCANSILGQFEDENYGSDELWREADCIRYFAGQINEDELIQLAHNHRYTLAMFHCSIAFKSFARGERQRAREHFQLAVDTDTIGSSDYDIALAYLTRMKADETWPQWLKEDHET
jgi:hypothetical protein